MKINYITNIPPKQSSGGWSGINLNIYKQLSKRFEVNYIGPINPPFNLTEKAISKVKRAIGAKADFAFFSEKRLNNIKNQLSVIDISEVDAYFFFGNTPWVKTYPNKPYFVYLDADFITYLKVFSNYSKFSNKSIQRIASQEEKWLNNATAIFFGSHWIKNETIRNLKLPNKSNKHIVVSTGGHIPIPDKDTYTYKKDDMNLLFIALNFEKKGGFEAVNIFLECQKNIPKVGLTIIGEKPPPHILEIKGIKYLGRLSKNKTNELKIMEEAFQKASFLVHPTKMDTMGAIIPEANYFGTPAIASNRFGVPDLIKDGVTGFLIQADDDAKIISSKMVSLFQDKDRYLYTRYESRKFSIENYSWEAIGEKIANTISKTQI
jgi:glycosyltransferase involved in cell wall biosynthesis